MLFENSWYMILAWRACMDGVELPPMLGEVIKCVCLVELEWITRLRFDVHSDNFKARAMVSHPCTPCLTKQIQ